MIAVMNRIRRGGKTGDENSEKEKCIDHKREGEDNYAFAPLAEGSENTSCKEAE